MKKYAKNGQDLITKYWIAEGNNFLLKNQKITPTSRDPYLGRLETDNILDYLNKDDVVLEVGCGDCQHTIEYAKKVKKIYGIDIVESLVEIGRKRINRNGLTNAKINVGTAIDLERVFAGDKMDSIISQRFLINIASWQSQKRIIKKIYNSLKPGGYLLLSEGFIDGFIELNKLRKKLNLPPVVPVKYNCNFKRRQFENFVKKYFDILEVRDYGIYLLLSRIITPLVSFPKLPKHDSRINEACMKLSKALELSGTREYSYNLFYVLRKKSINNKKK